MRRNVGILFGFFALVVVFSWYLLTFHLFFNPFPEDFVYPDDRPLTQYQVEKLDSLHRVDRNRLWVRGVDY